MTKTSLFRLALILTLVSCSHGYHKPFAALDRAIEMQDTYDRQYVQLLDSLRRSFMRQTSDTARWSSAYALEKINFYHNVDSCYKYCLIMIALSGNDPARISTGEAALANILYKMDSLQTALRVLERIDTASLTPDGLAIYCFAGHHIYGELAQKQPEYEARRRAVIERWWAADSLNMECTYYHNADLRKEGRHREALARLERCPMATRNDTAKANYCLAREYLAMGDTDNAIRHFAQSAKYDMLVSAKTYNSLYELARLLFREGDIERADRYMRLTLGDALASSYKTRYNDIILSELDILNALMKQQEQKKWAYAITILTITLLLGVALIFLLILSRYSARLNHSRSVLSEVSSIKDGFLAGYMEKCVDYLNKVDEYRSSLRKTLRNDGTDAVKLMLRKPSFAAGEFDGLLTSFDKTFLSIFPDFVDKVNGHMQPGYELTMPQAGTLSTELRILALIKMGIVKRQKIAKILNMSVTTVYSYHCNLQKHSRHPDSSFDRVIASM